MEEKILTRELVKKLGLDKVEHITADMLEGYTEIGSIAFYYCGSLTSVTIPNNVTNIGLFAFSGCSGLTSIIVESGNTVYDSRNNCNAIIETATNTLIAGCQSTIIPNSVTSIGEMAFSGCSDLTSVTIGNSVTSIGKYAFAYCRGLTSVTIPNSVTSIGEGAFDGCSGLTSVTIPNSVTNIGMSAFQNCSSLTSVTIPNSVTSIEGFAFCGCSSLTSIEIPNNVTNIGDYAFHRCTGLTSVTIPNSVTSIGDYAFRGCDSLASVTIPNSVTSIGWCAFLDCSKLASVTIGDVEYKLQEVIDGKCKAYKAFKSDMTCRAFQYEKGKTYEIDGEIRLCKRGFHACLKLSDVFNYYTGKLGKDIHIHEVELEGVSEENFDDSKVVASKITIGKRII